MDNLLEDIAEDHTENHDADVMNNIPLLDISDFADLITKFLHGEIPNDG